MNGRSVRGERTWSAVGNGRNELLNGAFPGLEMEFVLDRFAVDFIFADLMLNETVSIA